MFWQAVDTSSLNGQKLGNKKLYSELSGELLDFHYIFVQHYMKLHWIPEQDCHN